MTMMSQNSARQCHLRRVTPFSLPQELLEIWYWSMKLKRCLLFWPAKLQTWVLFPQNLNQSVLNRKSLANEDTSQLYMLCGRGPRSSLRVLRHGLEVSEMAVSELPGNPNAVWTVKKRFDGGLILLHSSQPVLLINGILQRNLMHTLSFPSSMPHLC
jgi:hypothetical protein